MMKVVYSEMDTPAGISCRLEAAGHAGYAPAGQDIVCAGASTVMQGLVCLLAGEESASSDAFDEPDGPRLAGQTRPAQNGCRVPLNWPRPALHCWLSATRRMSALRM